MKRILIALLLSLCITSGVKATHIVGAELIYECVDSTNHLYDITLKLYRDCLNGQAPYDPTIVLFVFRGSDGSIAQTVSIPVPPTTPQIQPEDWDDCVAVIPNICVEEGIYTTQITLPPIAGGYNLGWSRCCRNQAINNLSNPLGEGITFLSRVPGPEDATCNSQPDFTQVPPIFLCNNQTFSFDHSAIDPDGDSLVYKLVNPFTGTNLQGLGTGNPMMGGNQPTVDPNTNPMGPPPYQNVNFAAGFSFTDPFGSGNFVLDPITGFLTVTPNQTGIFVYAIAVAEYRNGVLLSENRRDFQIHIINCLPPGVPPTISHDLTGLNHSNDTIYVEAGMPFCYDVTVQDQVANDILVSYSVSAPFGNGNFSPPAATWTHSGTNPINGQVCWTPSCNYDGQTVPLIIGAYDLNECQNVGDVFDTVWVQISVPPNQPPVIVPDYTGLFKDNDTIIVSAGSAFCYDFTITDPNLGDIIQTFPISPIFSAPNGPTLTFAGNNPVNGQVCWTPGCDFEGQIVELNFGATDVSICNGAAPTQSKVFVKITVPPNAPPGIVSDLSGNVFNGDTIFVNALENLCFDFTATDPNLSDVLTYMPISPIFNNPNGPTVTTSGNNPLQGQVCWTPSCDYENQIIPLIYSASDPGVCSNIGIGYDTVYISVAVPPNSPPLITSDLSGTNFNEDTIFVNANDGFCYTFVANDPNTGDILNAFANSPIFNQPDGPSFSSTGNNPLTGQICWTPSCNYVGQVVDLIIGAEDNGKCSGALDAFDTVHVVINLPPNDPPEIFHNLTGLNTDGDTIFLDAQESLCYNISISDPNVADTLTAFGVSPIFNDPDGPTFTWSGENPLQGQVCWTASCDYEGQVIEIVLRAEDNGDCNNILEDFDTVFVKISDPVTIPPIVGHDLSDNSNVVGDTIYIEIGDGLCYDFYVADQTTENGVNFNHTFDFATLAGTNITLTSLNVETRNDSIIGTVCFASDCSNGGSTFRSIITGSDKETCPPFATASDTVYIKVNTDFKSFAGVDASFCEGTGGVQLNATPIGGTPQYYYSWGCTDTLGCGLSSPAVSNPIANPTDTTTYFVQITDRNGCTSEIDDVRVNVKKLPIADAGPDIFLCEGDPGTNLNCTILNPVAAPGPYTYTWLPPTGLNNPNLVNPYATPDTTTIYTVVVSSANGCTSDNTTLDTLSTVTVHVNPRPVVEAGPDIDICLGGDTLLRGFASEAGPDYSYVWTPATGLNDSSMQTPQASPPRTTTYFLVAWSNGCPSVADSMTVVVHALPTSDPGTAYEICGGDSIELNGIAGGDPTATYTYEWAPPRGLSNPFAAKPEASPDTTTTYKLVATSSYGCVGPEYDVTVNVIPAPKANAGLDSFICRGDSLQLQGSHTMIGGPANGPIFYDWAPVTGLDGRTIPDPKVSPEGTIVYELTVSLGSCASTDAVKIDVFDPVEAFASADTNRICSGDSVQLFAIGGSGAATYTWLPTSGLSDPTAANPMAAPENKTTYTVVVQEGACKDEAMVEVLVNPTPVADYLSSVETGCEDLTVAFFENSPNAIGYIWDFGDGSPISNDANPVHTYTVPGTYTVSMTATGVGGCNDIAQTKLIEVTPKGSADYVSDPPVAMPNVLPNAEISFLDQSSNAVSYVWDFGDGQSSTAVNPVHIYREAGEYTVSLTITDAGGCTDVIQYGPFIVFEPNLLIPNVFTPNADGVNDEFRVTYDGKEAYSMEIFDRWGRPVFAGNGSIENGWDGSTSNGSPASDGVYYYIVKIGEKSFTGNVTLMR